MSSISIPTIHANLEKIFNKLLDEEFDMSDTSALKERLRELYNESKEFEELSPNRLTGALNQFIKKKADIISASSKPKSKDDDSDDDPPKKKSKDDDSDDDPPKKKSKDDDSDDPPKKKSKDDKKPAIRGRKPLLSIEDIVESRSTEGLSTEDIASKGKKDYVKFPTTQCNRLHIQTRDNPYELSKPVKPCKNFPDQCTDLTGAEDAYVAFVVGESDQHAYTEAVSDYQDAVHKLRAIHKIKATKNKRQRFTFVKPTETEPAKVKFLDPENDGKIGELPTKDAQPIITFHNILDEFTNKWNNQAKNVKAKFLQYLCLDVIRTQNILAFPLLKKIHEDVFEEYTSKLTNTILSSDAKTQEWYNADDDLVCVGKDVIYITDYTKLFDAARSLNTKNLSACFKSIFTNRKGIVLHPACTDEFKREAWLQALANILAFDTADLSEHEQLVFNAWRNVLSSRFAFRIIMNCVPSCSEFDHAIQSLIQEGVSVRLFESLLYPISFVCTPLMLGYKDFSLPKNSSKLVQTKYTKVVNELLNTLSAAELKLTDYEKCFWIFYSNADDGRNIMVELIHNAIMQTPIIKDIKASSKGKSKSTKSDSK